jgi:Leucine-rich repeat (LRR) protein
MPERADWKKTLSKTEATAVAKLEQQGAVIKPFDVDEIEFHGIVIRFDDDQQTKCGLLSSASAQSLGELKNAILELRQTRLNKQDLARIYELRNLEGLDLAATSGPKISWKTVAKMKSLQMLDVSDNGVSDIDVKEFVALKKLRSLSLINTGITDECVVHLAALKNLRELYVARTKLTADGKSSLRKSLPKCEIID